MMIPLACGQANEENTAFWQLLKIWFLDILLAALLAAALAGCAPGCMAGCKNWQAGWLAGCVALCLTCSVDSLLAT